MKLAFKYYPFSGDYNLENSRSKNLIILHGLFGSSKNWVSVSKIFSSVANVYSLDLRNHGDSPHNAEHSIRVMASDLAEFIADHSLVNVSLLGHSMGGLVALYFDLNHTDTLERLIIQDISPRSYPFGYNNEIVSMKIDISHCNSRSEVDLLMKDFVPDAFIRQFLQMNLERADTGKYFWKLNIENISNARQLFENAFADEKPSLTKSIFILGENSEYIIPSDLGRIRSLFPHSEIVVIPGGGHYIHYTHMDFFTNTVLKFLKS